MPQRVAKYIKKVVFPVSRVLADVSTVVIVLLMLLVVVQIISRRFFNAPIKGSLELTELTFSIIVFCPMAWCAMRDGHVDLSVLVDKFPKIMRKWIEVIILLITTAILGLLSWQLLMQGIRLQVMTQETALLGIPVYPFIYLATLSMLMMAFVFLVKFLDSLSETVGRIK